VDHSSELSLYIVSYLHIVSIAKGILRIME
jgi:hypothetical protein